MIKNRTSESVAAEASGNAPLPSVTALRVGTQAAEREFTDYERMYEGTREDWSRPAAG